MPRTQQTVKITLPSQLGYEKVAMDTARNLAKLAGLSAEREKDLCTAVAEACINAMQHGNKFSPRKFVDLVFRLKKDALEIEVYDSGNGMRKNPPKPVLEKKLAREEAARGWGVYLMQQLVDEVEFGMSKSHGHVTRLVMKLPATKAA